MRLFIYSCYILLAAVQLSRSLRQLSSSSNARIHGVIERNTWRTSLYLSEGDSGGDNFRVVSPRNIASLFGAVEKSNQMGRGEKKLNSKKDEDEYDDSIYDVDDENELEELLVSSKGDSSTPRSAESKAPSKVGTEIDESSPVMQELRAVESLKFSSPSAASRNVNSEGEGDEKRRPVDELEAQYMNLGQTLDQVQYLCIG